MISVDNNNNTSKQNCKSHNKSHKKIDNSIHIIRVSTIVV